MAKDISKKELAAKKARRAQKEMLAYMEENNLDPKKDWTGHKKHGKKIQAWIDVINLGNKKARELNEERAIEKEQEAGSPSQEGRGNQHSEYLRLSYGRWQGDDFGPEEEVSPEDAYSSEDDVEGEGRSRRKEVCCRAGFRFDCCSKEGEGKEGRAGQGKEGRETCQGRQGQEEEKEGKERGGLNR